MKRFLISIHLAAFTTLHAHAAAADEAKRYTVQAGDTCAAIATRFYGDARLVDLIHGANPGMGPSPHALKPGTVLILPPRPGATPEGPDARLTRTKNIVEVQAPDPRPGKPNDPLYRGNRVGTRESSTADVTFRDETQVKLGENTLVVILGDAQARAARVGAQESTLVTGSLRARLSELAGKGTDKPRVATEGGSVELKSGEAQVTVDDKKTTRVAVYEGSSTLQAQKKEVAVNEGFGSKADLGVAPTPPKPLPEAPSWSSAAAAIALASQPVDLTFTYRPSAGGAGTVPASTPAASAPTASAPAPAPVASAPAPASAPAASAASAPIPPPAEWHVQVARDKDFNDVVVDGRVPLATSAIEVKNAGPGAYYARVSAIDDDRFEGKWSTVASYVVAQATAPPLPGRRALLRIEPAGLACALDGAPVAGPIEIDRSAAHVLACEAGGARAALDLPKVSLGRVQAVAALERLPNGAAVMRVRVVDEAGTPVPRVAVALVSAPAGMRVGPFTYEGGAYVAPATIDGRQQGGALQLRVDDDAVVATNPLPPDPEPRVHVEVAAGARVSRVLQQPGAGVSLEGRLAVRIPAGELLVGAQAIYEGVPRGTSDPGYGYGDTQVRADVLGGWIPIGYRLGARDARFAPYLTVGFAGFWSRGRVEPEGQSIRSRALMLGGAAALGAEYRLGGLGSLGGLGAHGAAFAELSGRLTTDIQGTRAGPPIDTSGAAFSLGYRYGF
ncbi:MAG: FecR domain-containing protein [Labilithrix sp.]|nr:FecR domain-containing protein [Labilithrix sp.]MCW5811834.1 FecR domain-containing protein [Labilithrix sp.]